MEPAIPDLQRAPKGEAYRQLRDMQALLLAGSDDVIAAMATTTALLHHAFGHLWTGFYRVVEPGALLRVGPYQGSLGCLDIAFGRGVCGTAAAERRTIVVADVATFPGHITCDPRSQSEIVVPVLDASGALLAVLDIDSAVTGRFDDEDREGVESLVDWFQRASYVPTPARATSEVVMPVIGYSDRINHAMAFAAKHHDQQVRKGTRLPYLTRPANVAVILTRYGRDEDTTVAGILYDVVEDCVRDGWPLVKLEERVGTKFGNSVLNTALSVAERRIDDDGIELSHDDRKADYLLRLSLATEDALWVSAAHNLHNVSSILSDLHRTAFPETVWGRFASGKERTVRMYLDVAERLQEIGFRGAIADELRTAARELEALSTGSGR